MNPATEMNCLALRRAKLADPKRVPNAALRHQAECAACEHFARRIEAQEERLRRALQVPLPDGLEERVLLAVRARRALPWRAWAMAASVLLSIGAGLLLFRPASQGHDPARLAIEHVLHEPEAFTTERLADAGEFRNVVAHFGGELQASLGEVRYMKLCPGPDGVGWHVVLQTTRGLVSLFLMPQQGMRATRTSKLQGFEALAVPGGRGYYAIVAADSAALTDFAAQFKQNIRWRI